ncbi:MAG: GDSL-type esterase/lipase family protein [Verrucomicrobiae bacterium]|nr:GDSL-type esterase/lipase family protein [Verrucomicrobiae bacterium]
MKKHAKACFSRVQLARLGFSIPSVNFADEIAAFGKTVQNPDQPVGVLFVGNSDIRRWDKGAWDRHFSDLLALNRGFGGARTWETLIYFDRIVLPYKPRVIVYCAGDNDIAKLGAEGVKSAVRGFKLFAEMVNLHLPETKRILYLAIHPSPCDRPLWGYIAAANRELRRFCRQSRKACFVDYLHLLHDDKGELRANCFEKDGLHFTPEFYEELSGFLEPMIRKALGGKR